MVEIVCEVENLKTLRTEVLIAAIWPRETTFLIVEVDS
jgi:hypothetical protein